MYRFLTRVGAAAALVCLALAGSASAALRVRWLPSVKAAGTPVRYDKVGVLKVGARHARNVLVLEPGTEAGSAYFVPLAQWIVSRAPGWQVWSVERRENLLEDQSVLNRAKTGRATDRQLFDYYLGFIKNTSIKRHFRFIPNSKLRYAKRWGLRVAVGDLHTVIAAARRLGGKVVLGGHSLGGGVTTAYATWNFGGRPGADQLAGLIYIDGGSFGQAESASAARTALKGLNASATGPWQSFGGITAPFAGIFNASGSTAALIDPNSRSLGQSSGLLDGFGLTPSVPVTNLGEYGFALNVGSSPTGLVAAQAHLGRGITSTGSVRGWDGRAALTPIGRFARMFSGAGVSNADGTEWYFPERLTLDLRGVGNGVANPAQRVLGLRATLGRRLPRRLLIYGFGARLGGQTVLNEARALAVESHIPVRNLTLINRAGRYAHNDPAGAYPHNVFFAHLMTFLHRVAARGR
jgi:pimeloyl-ACP methyl ester carboxylesterase